VPSTATVATDHQIDPPTWLQCQLCRKIFRSRGTPTDWSEAWGTEGNAPLDADGIAEMVRIAEAALDDERSRGRQLDGKTTTLAGFSGLILSINAALARSIFTVDLGGVGNVVARAGFIVSAIAMMFAVSLAIAGVLMPQKHRTTGIQAIDEFGSPPLQARSKRETQRALLPSLTSTLIQERSVNDCKARLCKGVAAGQLIGFLGLATVAVTLAQHSLV
jgi:hypothetical protein